MLGLIYLIISTLLGFFLLKFAFPKLFNISNIKSLNNKVSEIANFMVILPASFLTGIIIFTWITYLSAYFMRGTGKPMFFGNLISFTIGIVVMLVVIIKCGKSGFRLSANEESRDRFHFNEHKLEFILIGFVLVIFGYLIFHSFFISSGTMFVGFSVASDFGPHLSMIRSFSQGLNFPTQYPHFADGTIRYHFMFQFLAGNLEYLGMRIDWAFNLPSILSMLSFLMLLYSYAVILFEKKWIGFLTVILFTFRSSFAIFTYIFEKGSLGKAVELLLKNETHIGKTPYEEWGLWGQKTFINQRHLPLGIGIMLIVLIISYPSFKKMLDELLDKKSMKLWLKECLLAVDSWSFESYKQPIILGILFGLTAFWNGAVVIGTLPVLFIIALLSKHRLEILVTAVITVALSYAESVFFFGSGNSAVSPQIVLGFIASDRSLIGVIKYYLELMGFLPFVIMAGVVIVPRGAVWLAMAFGMPLIVASTLQLTPDIVVNHKYVFLTIILVNIIAAYFLYQLFSHKNILARVIASVIILCMTLTGLSDFITENNIDMLHVGININDPIKIWVEKNTKPREVFLTDIYATHPILLAGRPLYCGWPYFAWSAGYPTQEREGTAKQIYSETNATELKELVRKNNISYIVVDDKNRESKEYKLNEALIANSFILVYHANDGNMNIYRTY